MNIVMLGSGNVASHLSWSLKNAGHQIMQVWSRNYDHAQELALTLPTQATHQLSTLVVDADLYIVAVADDAIQEVLQEMPAVSGCVVHTSGSTGMAVVPAGIINYGVLYPLQTFSKDKAIDFSKVPILLEASNEGAYNVLNNVALSISGNVQVCTTEQRRTLHIAAVFSCNFSNHLYVIAQRLLEENGLAFDLIRPLIHETSEKIRDRFPNEVQTGPAIRNDQMTLKRHREYLAAYPDWLTLYEHMSNGIQKEAKNRK